MSATISTDVRRSRLRLEVEQELEALFSRQQTTAQAYGPEFSHLWAVASEQVAGGKLVRPILFLEAYDALRWATEPSEAFGEAALAQANIDRAEVVKIAAAIEALHFTFLLHDDVIDGDLVRRGQLNLIGDLALVSPGTEPSRQRMHWAQTGGILAGDLLLSVTHQIFARLDVPADIRIRMLDLLEHTIVESTAGEFADVGLSDGLVAPDLNTVLAMTRRKTASYTFEFPLRAAVILAGGSSELEHTLSAAGSHLGLAYQLQDDLLSVFGDPEIHGKDSCTDLREGKQTAIICYARMTSAWPSIEPDLGDPELSPSTAAYIRSRLRDCGAERFVESLIDEQLTAFYELLAGRRDSHQVPSGLRAVLLDLVGRLEGRQA